ncbi:lipoprotein [Halomonas qinghailakensis]|uniref:Lipoprotein n=2 Tax=Halomonas TaxID=2745 RepID=A0AA46TTL7_9GAMM|nr:MULTISPECIES: lipoprotein [Halomonas]UYO76106.1 lipoprotein [Halomonas sp. ZZQ-149]UYV19022.1 lipoprotein [Halomonas qaidamensis]
MKRVTTIFSTVLLVTLLLVGCGQKGPLYMPDEDTQGSAAEQEG